MSYEVFFPDDIDNKKCFNKTKDQILKSIKNKTILTLHGPAGTAKTTLTKFIVKKLGKPAISIACNSLYVAENPLQRFGTLIKKTEGFDVIILDEVDSITKDRTNKDFHNAISLQLLESVMYFLDKSKKAIIIATANEIGLMDGAPFRRLKPHILVDRVSYNDRKCLTKNIFENFKPTEKELKTISELTKGYTTNEMIEFLESVLKTHKINKKRRIKLGFFNIQREIQNPYLTNDDMDKWYERNKVSEDERF